MTPLLVVNTPPHVVAAKTNEQRRSEDVSMDQSRLSYTCLDYL